jgi:septum site-determining protein MinD
MARKIVFTSGKGGVGKTTIATRLGAYLAEKGERVIVCDCDFGLNNVDIATGVENLVNYDLVDILEGKCRAKQALVRHPDFPNLHVLTSSHSSPERYVSPQPFKLALNALAPQFDFIIIDCPSGIDEGFHRAVAVADEAIVVTSPHISALRDADKTITLLKSYDLKNVLLAVNKVRGDLLASGESLSPTESETLLKIPLLGVVPEDYTIYGGEFACLHSAFKTLANNLLTGKRKIYDTTRKYVGVIGALRRTLKKSL